MNQAFTRVLVIEDEYFIAEDLVRVLRAKGLGIAGPVADHPAALMEIDRQSVHFAVADINLEGCISFDIAVRLHGR